MCQSSLSLILIDDLDVLVIPVLLQLDVATPPHGTQVQRTGPTQLAVCFQRGTLLEYIQEVPRPEKSSSGKSSSSSVPIVTLNMKENKVIKCFENLGTSFAWVGYTISINQ